LQGGDQNGGVGGAHLAPLGAQDVELARALLPVLLARIARTTRRLERIEERLALESAPGSAPELAREAQEAEALGWLLGCIAGGLGSELLLERHEPRALELALGLVAEAVGSEGRALAPRTWPRVSKAGGWRLAWATAGLAWRAAASSGRELVELDLARDGDQVRVGGACAPDAALASRGCELERELEGSRFDARGDGWSWSFPAAWLEATT
jgi:hypothetical protein